MGFSKIFPAKGITFLFISFSSYFRYSFKRAVSALSVFDLDVTFLITVSFLSLELEFISSALVLFSLLELSKLLPLELSMLLSLELSILTLTLMPVSNLSLMGIYYTSGFPLEGSSCGYMM